MNVQGKQDSKPADPEISNTNSMGPSSHGSPDIEDIDLRKRFDEVVKQEDRLVVISFWAPWCRNCKKIAPFVDQLAKTNEKLFVYRVNTTFAEDIGAQQGIDALPTFQFFRGGVQLGDFKGSNMDAFQKVLNNYI